MRAEKGRRREEKENDSEGRSGRGRKGRRYASGLKPPKPKNAGYVPVSLASKTRDLATGVYRYIYPPTISPSKLFTELQ